MDKLQAKQTAKKGWVSDFLYNVVSKNNEQYNKIIGDVGAELTFELAIMRDILINKLNITESDITDAEKRVMEQQIKDASIIKKYKNAEDKTIEEKLKIMKEEGMSERGLVRMEFVLKEMEKAKNPEPQTEEQNGSDKHE